MFLGKNAMHHWRRIYFLGVFVAILAFGSANMSSTAGDSGELAVDCDAMIDIHVPQNPQHADFVMRVQFSQRLVCLVRSEAVYRAFLSRVGLHEKYRREAIEGLARLHETTRLDAWFAAIDRLDKHGVVLDPRQGTRRATSAESRSVLDAYASLLTQWDKEELKGARDALHGLIQQTKTPQIRSLCYAGLLESGVDPVVVWELAAQRERGLADLLDAGAWIPLPVRDVFWQRCVESQDFDAADTAARVRFARHVSGRDHEIFNYLVAQLHKTTAQSAQRNNIIAVLASRDVSNWPADAIQSLGEEFTQWYSALSVKDRNSGAAKKLKQLIEQIARRLPDGEKQVLLARLKGLEVAEYKITALREQLAFDQEVLVLQAGQPVEITFRNQDTMPHNLVMTRPGAMEKVGVAADQMALLPGDWGKQYVPETTDVLHYTEMIGSGKSAKLVFTAPEEEGVYPLLCTFPGHWLKMFAAVVVTGHRAAYLTDNQPLPSRDVLLGIKNYVHQFDDLSRQLEDPAQPRSFSRGETAFYSRACVSCHAVGGKGGRVGPELSSLAGKQKQVDILRSIMYPSEKIDPVFAKVEVEQLESGKRFTGVLIPQADSSIVYVIEDPLAECEPQVFDRADVEIVPLKMSPMPEDLLRRSSPDEVLDLVAYLFSGGNPEHPVYVSDGDE
jgi:putative heme-binding domain-containing protein